MPAFLEGPRGRNCNGKDRDAELREAVARRIGEGTIRERRQRRELRMAELLSREKNAIKYAPRGACFEELAQVRNYTFS